jgi:hypothetical protein
LRKHLPAISAAGRDECLGLAQQQRLQALQFGVLQGSICMAARQGHQVRLLGSTQAFSMPRSEVVTVLLQQLMCFVVDHVGTCMLSA